MMWHVNGLLQPQQPQRAHEPPSRSLTSGVLSQASSAMCGAMGASDSTSTRSSAASTVWHDRRAASSDARMYSLRAHHHHHHHA